MNKNQLSLVELLKEKQQASGQRFFSIEICPPKTEQELQQLLSKLAEIEQKHKPVFCNVTQHDFVRCLGDDEQSLTSLKVADELVQRNLAGQTVLHLTCAGAELAQYEQFLRKAEQAGIRNWFVVRGDSANDPSKKRAFEYANQLCEYLRQHDGEQHRFSVGIAGYAVLQPTEKRAENLKILKTKIDSGADYVITQIVYSAESFVNFVDACRDQGIQIPIIAGLMPIKSYQAFEFLRQLGGIEFPEELVSFVESHKHDNEQILRHSVQLITTIANEILESGRTRFIHLYTLNDLETTLKIVEKINFKPL